MPSRLLQRRVQDQLPGADALGNRRPDAVTDPRWWRDEAQGTTLATGDISKFYADVDFSKLSAKVTDNSQIPTSGPIDRILASHFEPGQGADYSHECGRQRPVRTGGGLPRHRDRGSQSATRYVRR